MENSQPLKKSSALARQINTAQPQCIYFANNKRKKGHKCAFKHQVDVAADPSIHHGPSSTFDSPFPWVLLRHPALADELSFTLIRLSRGCGFGLPLCPCVMGRLVFDFESPFPCLAAAFLCACFRFKHHRYTDSLENSRWKKEFRC